MCKVFVVLKVQCTDLSGGSTTHGSVLCCQESQHATLWVYLQEERISYFHACIAPWPVLQITPFLHYSCPPGRVGSTESLIKFAQPFMRYRHLNF